MESPQIRSWSNEEIFVADSINRNGALQVVDIFGIQDPAIHHQTFPYLTRSGQSAIMKHDSYYIDFSSSQQIACYYCQTPRASRVISM
jgi:hypothetical protein